MSYEPKAGHFLRSSCSASDVYEILGSGKDENGEPTIDVRVLNLGAVIHCDDSDDSMESPLTRAELPAGVHLVLRHLQWTPCKDIGGVQFIRVNGPMGGCSRCCYLLMVHASPDGKDPVPDGSGKP